jgi:cystathionine beta-synthase
MRRHDVSQLPVIEGEAALAGLIDEWDILNAVRDNKENFKLPVRSVMSTDLVTLAPQDTLERVIGIFADNKVAPVIEQGNFLGLITQTDVINYWQQH